MIVRDAPATDRALSPTWTSPGEFEALLRRLREQVDQSGQQFSCIVLDRTVAAAKSLVQPLPTAVTEPISVAASWPPGKTSVLLNGVSAIEAEAIAEQLSPSRDGSRTWKVYEYPCERYWLEPWTERQQLDGDTLPMQWLFAYQIPVGKRAFDIVGALILLVVLSPVLLTIAVLTLLASGRPILFRQQRSGLGGRPFWMYKFRTMQRDAEQQRPLLSDLNEQDGAVFKMKHDPRVSPLGRWLRRLSLDELPQLFNVLLGEMSLVGPRPLPCYESADCAPWQRQRLDVTPGLTCYWQVAGRSNVTFEEWMQMDLDYVRDHSLCTDSVLLIRTVPAVLSGKGAY